MKHIVFLFVLVLFAGSATFLHAETADSLVFQSESYNCSTCHDSEGNLSGEIIELALTKNSSDRCSACHAPENIIQIGKKSSKKARLRGKYKKWNGKVYSTEVVAEKMVLIPAGDAYIGNNGRVNPIEGPGNEDERPLHKVYTDAYLIDKYEVTNANYRKFVDDQEHRVPRSWKKGFPEDILNNPVVYVDWFDAGAYCNWRGKRLPREVEWEKAARGGDTRSFPWGPAFDLSRANTPQYWLMKNKKGGTMPVGSFPEGISKYGLLDMSGNVYEWVEDWYLSYPGNHYPNQHYGQKNKILRGGSWYDCLAYACGMSAPVYNRARVTPKLKNSSTGFRCAMDVKKSDTAKAN